jgi:D-alanyl-D-alanine carboxypeptidase
MDFHTPKEIGELTFNPDADYTDYQWWLARTADGGWEIVTFGYGY